jgi:tRNA-specific 2-thiouridylase
LGSSKRVAVGMSGGVDSSVAAMLAHEAGFETVGVAMRISGAHACGGPEEEKGARDAREVCRLLGIPFAEVDLSEEYGACVLRYLRREYLSGRTPNPCIRCNQTLKFGLLVEKLSRESGKEFDQFATGHYARVFFRRESGRFALAKAADPEKDQSYFLCMLSQPQLSRALFPLGGLSKDDVRRLAREKGLPIHDKRDSQDFAAGNYRAALEGERSREGKVKDRNGAVLGTHGGIWSFTVGQRRGLGVARGEPMYVTGLDVETDTVFVGPESELNRRNLKASGVNWVSVAPPSGPMRAGVRIRYRHAEAPALVVPGEDGSAEVLFDEPQRSIAPGQWAVFYDGDLVLGGGAIERSW